ncbi:endonuclease MutS2 [Porphyromonas gulae]|uniref:endonuclease MutS2 n=1 Tax=Porphyromonas gulae TaxID=111105 RepID=UPI0026F23351|nr:Smr/MutS family protein [Porphyromonas gulae]
MIRMETYPHNFEEKVGFDEIRRLLIAHCLSPMGCDQVARMQAHTGHAEVSRLLAETEEMQIVLRNEDSFPDLRLADVREALNRIRPAGTYLEERELLDVAAALRTIEALIRFFHVGEEEDGKDTPYPNLQALLVDAMAFPDMERRISGLFDRFGKMKDNASPELMNIRRELSSIEKSISRTLQGILRTAQSEGWVDQGVQPSVRDGRLVIPVPPAYKRKVRGIVHDESGTGKTVFIEPAEIVEANNRIRELEAAERREIIRILIEVCDGLRPHIHALLDCYEWIGVFDFISAKARLSDEWSAIRPILAQKPDIRWVKAVHPLLLRSLRVQGRDVIPLDISLTAPDKRILVISGPNAGGKSVCLKTVGLLQYMLQSGLPVPMSPDSTAGVFDKLFIDIGDEQSIEDDLSTYSSHLKNMKHFARHTDKCTLLLIDEFGGGTEPQIGGAIAEALLHRFNEQKGFGVVTTHYQNLKAYAEETKGLVNGAMLYDRHEMRPLFRLSIGRPGSSFAIEIARKIGLPEEVIAEATDKVGTGYIDMDKYLQDIVRDKRYWETKRANIRKEEKRLEEAVGEYESRLEAIRKERKQILDEARQQAFEMLSQSSAQIERTIRDIKEAQAEKEKTRRVRQELNNFKATISKEEIEKEERINREIEKIKRRKKRKQEKAEARSAETPVQPKPQEMPQPVLMQVGDTVRIKGQTAVGNIIDMNDREATIALGMIKTTVSIDRLEQAKPAKERKSAPAPGVSTRMIIDQIHEKRLDFKQDIDLRGMRVNEAIQAVTYFIDDAIQLGIPRVRILHGTGTGALRTVIRDYLATVNGVTRFADEHVQFGGAGITVVELG